MKRTIKSIAGVTLLEIMLVLAIAAMVITMSVKYYGVANNNAHLNSAVEQIQSIAAAADTVAQSNGSYQSALSSSALSNVLPAGWKILPWGAMITATAGSSSFTLGVPNVPGQICSAFISRVISNSHFTASPTACTAGNGSTNVSFTYSP